MADNLVALRDRRDHVIARISDCYANDLLEIDELERRLDLAHGARTLAELDALVADLGLVDTSPAGSVTLVPAASVAIDAPNRAARERLRVMFSAVERRGRWIVPSGLQLRVLFGHAELDLREASLGPGTTTIDVRVTMANLDVILPPNLAIEVDVSCFAGNVGERHRVPPDFDPSRPILRIVGAVRFGNFEIATRLPGETEGDARRREKRERKQLAAAP